MLVGDEPHVGRLDTQCSVVGDHTGRGRAGLAEGSSDDAVVGNLGVEAVLDQQMALDPVDLDLQGAAVRVVVHGCGGGERPTSLAAQVLDGAQRRARGATDIVHAGLQRIEFLDHGERNDDVATGECVDACRVCHQNRRVEHDARCGLSGGRGVDDEVIDRARIARLDVCVVSTQRSSVWSVRPGQWWIPEPSNPPPTGGEEIFQKFVAVR